MERILHNASTKDGTTIPCLGFNFGLTLKRQMFNCKEVINNAEKLGIPTKVFKENTKKNSFVKAVKKKLGKVLDKHGTVIHQVEKSAKQIIFSVDRVVLTEEEIQMFDGETNIEQLVNSRNADYKPITRLVYDCESDKIYCDNQEVLSQVLKLLQVYEESYEKAQFTRHIRSILSSYGDIIPWVDAGHVYFVPARHKDLLFKLFELISILDPEAVINRGEVPDLTFSKQNVAESAEDSIVRDMKDVQEKLNDLYEKKEKLTARTINNTLESLSKSTRRIQEYTILSERNLGNAFKQVQEVQAMLKEYQISGKLPEKPKETIEESTKDEVKSLIDEL
jgi:hypothetical protein